MALKSKLSDKYQRADPALWLIGEWQELDPVFAGRLAHAARANGCRIVITEGYRSTARQTALYNQYISYKRTGKGNIKSAAKPGTSKHEFRLAVDTSTQPIRSMTNAQLKSYGLYKPIKSEGWHIEPIETSGLTASTVKIKLMPEEVEDLTKDEVIAIVKEVLSGRNTDVSDWAKESWDKATAQGIVDGKNPKGYPTREQVIVMLSRNK